MKMDIVEFMKIFFKEMGNDDEKCVDDCNGLSGCLRECFFVGGSCCGCSFIVEYKKL